MLIVDNKTNTAWCFDSIIALSVEEDKLVEIVRPRGAIHGVSTNVIAQFDSPDAAEEAFEHILVMYDSGERVCNIN